MPRRFADRPVRAVSRRRPQVDGNVSGVLQGDGVSWRQRLTVTELLFKKIPVTLELGLMGLRAAHRHSDRRLPALR